MYSGITLSFNKIPVICWLAVPFSIKIPILPISPIQVIKSVFFLKSVIFLLILEILESLGVASDVNGQVWLFGLKEGD